MADAATMTVQAVVLPEAIQKTFTGKTCVYTPADATEGWYYKKTDIAGGASPTTVDLIAGNFLNKAGDGRASDSARPTISTSDRVKFLYIENTGVQDDGSTSTNDSIYLTLDGNAVAHSSTICIEIRTGHVWFGNLQTLVGNIHAIAGRANGASVSTTQVQADVFAIIDDV